MSHKINVLAGIATLLNRVNLPNVMVAVDGSLYRFHPHFHNRMMEKTKELLNNGIKVREGGRGREGREGREGEGRGRGRGRERKEGGRGEGGEGGREGGGEGGR